MKQAYILPTPTGWAVELHGWDDAPTCPLPLPFTVTATWGDVVAGFSRSPYGSEADMIDGWPSETDLRRNEPELWASVWASSL